MALHNVIILLSHDNYAGLTCYVTKMTGCGIILSGYGFIIPGHGSLTSQYINLKSRYGTILEYNTLFKSLNCYRAL